MGPKFWGKNCQSTTKVNLMSHHKYTQKSHTALARLLYNNNLVVLNQIPEFRRDSLDFL